MDTGILPDPFNVTCGRFRFRFTPEETGGFSVYCINVRGICTQGETFEEALRNAFDAAALVEECQKSAAEEKASGRTSPSGELLTRCGGVIPVPGDGEAAEGRQP